MTDYDIFSSLFSYDKETGHIKRLYTWKRHRSGDKAGCLTNQGYRSIRYSGRDYLEHRIAWLLSYGHWPEAEIDHINGDRSDNRIKNLRLAKRIENCRNTSIRKDNSTGYKGVSKVGKRFRAQISCSGKVIHLGRFDTAKEAHEAYRKASSEYHGEFGNHGC